MIASVIFSLIEYSLIPVFLIMISKAIKELSSSDPVTQQKTNDANHLFETPNLEILIVLAASTLLYGISFFSHSGQHDLNKIELICVITCMAVCMVQMVVILYFVYRVRNWGRDNRKSKWYYNILAWSFWFLLTIIIISCKYYCHSYSELTQAEIKKSPSEMVEKRMSDYPFQESVIFTTIDNLKNNNQDKKEWLYSWPFYCVILGSVLLLLLSIRGFRYYIRKVRNRSIINYNIGSNVKGDEPDKAIENLKKSLLSLPEDSPLRIDICMKLSKIYIALDEKDTALKQFDTLQNSKAYPRQKSFLTDGILSAKFDLLMELDRVDDAEALIKDITTKETMDKLKVIIFDYRYRNPKSNI